MKASFTKELAALLASTALMANLFAQSSAPESASLQTTGLSPAGNDAASRVNQYTVLLHTKPLSAAYADALAQGHRMTDSEQRVYVANLRAAQTSLLNQITALGGQEIARSSLSLNALFVTATASTADQIAGLNGVRKVQVVSNFKTMAGPSSADFKEVVPLIGANTLRESGRDGTGVRVAVLDSGIDYTHAAFGGGGTAAAYYAAYGTSTSSPENKSPVSWPQGRVVDGFDFVGEQWPLGPLAPDPDPIASPSATNTLGIVGTDGSHGTSVADIIAGGPFPGRPDNHGVAPGASLLAVKVCSAVSTSCSGIAIILGIDFSLDPDGDGSISDAVDVINLSLGADFGQKENPSTEAVSNAVRAGIVVCCAAGNAGDSPYILSSPANAPEAIAVAQTSVPSAKVFILAITSSTPPSPVSITNTNTVDWAPIVGTTTGTIAAPSSPLACARLPANSLSGKIALIDRGTCNISFKVAYAQDAGAIGVILANNAPGDPPSFSFGGIPPDLPASFTITIPVIVVSQADGASLKSRVAAGQSLTATFSDTSTLSTAETIVASSSRGPSFDFNTIKPEIGAPGGNLAAVSGSGTGFATFSGTSGATPVIAGSAALVLQQHPGLSPLEVKARLMNNAEINIFQNPVLQPGVFAPISRVGAGEVRALPAVEATAAAWVAGGLGEPSVPALSFGYWRLSAVQSFTQTVRVKNDADHARSFSIATSSRFAPGSPGAVTLATPGSISVSAGATADFTVTLTVDPAKLPLWSTNSGALGGDGPSLTALEYGGYVTLSSETDTLRLPWHILPQRAHRALVSTSTYTLGTPAPTITNTPSSLTAVANVYALTGTSPRLPAGSSPATGASFTVTDLQNVGVRLVSFPAPIGLTLEFAITTWDRRTHANFPAQFVVNIDVDNDGFPDWFLFNQEASDTDHRNITFLQGATWGTAFGTFLTTVDFNSATVVMQVPLNRIGLTIPAVPSSSPVPNPLPTNLPFSFSVDAFDDYFTGDLTDEIGPMTYTAGQPKYVVGGTLGSITVAPGATVNVPIMSTGLTSSPSQSGILLLFPNGRTNFESKAIRVTP